MRNPNSKIFVVRQYGIRRRASLAPSFFALQALAQTNRVRMCSRLGSAPLRAHTTNLEKCRRDDPNRGTLGKMSELERQGHSSPET